ncbi:hypothetical protein N790_06785 [Arenimonas malthae CC-JY-1]|uniref:DUF4262 domain-containing protein n=1 Tax=Arenimonas malthae CC-JY-1 TaxID=1384054 RepID=A0A091B8Y5_9GAMM|nr:DUF4262 domain-containing protein [Arenimonas malthae]KFN48206.1 hypothetical protein N790_06785 [Arenimonas malthae CC-JY-1]
MALNADQERVLADIRKYGCHVIQVLAEGDLPPYAYSIGISRTSDSPDVCVFGLPADKSHRLLHHYNKRVREGERFESGQVLQGFIKGMDCVLRPVHESQLREHFGWNLWLHDGRPFPMLQLVYPTNEGIWPWSEMASDWLRRWQPLLEQPAYTD